MAGRLDNTYGAAFIGMVVAAVLYGVTCVQALHYFTTQNDSWYMKFTVTVVMILDTAHQALITHAVYTYTVTHWGDANRVLLIPRWGVLIELIFTGVTAFIVQSFLTMRIWRLSRRNIYITGISAVLAIGGFVNLIMFITKASQIKQVADLPKIKALSISINALNAAADVLIAATLCILLNFSRTGFHKTEVLINRLILFTVTTGLPTSLCALASLISILVGGQTFIYSAFIFCLGRLYTTTLLATLNARKLGHEGGSASISVPFSDFHDSRSNQTQKISIHVDTTTQKYHPSEDPKFDNPRDEESSTKVSY